MRKDICPTIAEKTKKGKRIRGNEIIDKKIASIIILLKKKLQILPSLLKKKLHTIFVTFVKKKIYKSKKKICCC